MTEPDAPEIDEIRERCSVEVFNPAIDRWEDVRDDVMVLEKGAFGAELAFDEEDVREVFHLQGSIVILLKDGQKIVGYTYTVPLSHYEDNIEQIEREDGGKKTAYIDNTVLDPQYHGHKLVPKMMAVLEAELVRNGFEFLERDTVIANNYAANVEKNYKARGLLLVAGGPHPSPWGPQRFFRIRLA